MKILPLLVIGCAPRGDEVPELEPASSTRCVGHWFHTTDGVPDAEGREVHDAVGRTVEAESNSIGSVGGSHYWWVWETDTSGTDRMLEGRYDTDGDDDADLVVTYGYALDDRLRLAWTATWTEGSPDREETYTYDDEDQLVGHTSTADGPPAARGSPGRTGVS